MKKLREVARDSKGQVMWVHGRTHLSPLTYREWREGKDMTSGRIKKSIYTFHAPFTTNMEDCPYINIPIKCYRGVKR